MMTDKTEHHEKDSAGGDDRAKQHEKAGASKKKAAAETEGFSDPLEFLNAELERAETDRALLHDKNLRLVAEMENLRKRTQRDIAEAREYSIAAFAREMLAVADNLARALESVSEEARTSADDSLKALIEGVELTGKSMQQALEKSGVKRISPLNQRFDPNFHQAMFEIPNAEIPSNTVLQVVQDGYVIGDRVLRPAMVGISRGGPKQHPAPDEEALSGSPAADGTVANDTADNADKD
jgi:molecular chaperone GrpE